MFCACQGKDAIFTQIGKTTINLMLHYIHIKE